MDNYLLLGVTEFSELLTKDHNAAAEDPEDVPYACTGTVCFSQRGV